MKYHAEPFDKTEHALSLVNIVSAAASHGLLMREIASNGKVFNKDPWTPTRRLRDMSSHLDGIARVDHAYVIMNGKGPIAYFAGRKYADGHEIFAFADPRYTKDERMADQLKTLVRQTLQY